MNLGLIGNSRYRNRHQSRSAPSGNKGKPAKYLVFCPEEECVVARERVNSKELHMHAVKVSGSQKKAKCPRGHLILCVKG